MCFSNDSAGGDALTEMPVERDTRELLAWYVNGTLTGSERDRVEASLQSEAVSLALLAWEREVQQAAIKSDPALEIAADRGLFQAMQRIRAESRPVVVPPRAVRGGWFLRPGGQVLSGPRRLPSLAAWSPFNSRSSPRWWTAPSEGAEFADVRAIGVKPAAADAFIRVAFKPDSTGGDVIVLLRTLRAGYVAGPSQLGDYYLLVARNGAADALSALQTSASVESRKSSMLCRHDTDEVGLRSRWRRSAIRVRAGVFFFLASSTVWAYDIVSGENRLALVIGNASYRSAPLRNPVNDAQAVAAALKALGFQIILRENAGQRKCSTDSGSLPARAEKPGAFAVLCRARRADQGPQLSDAGRCRGQ